MHRKVNPATLIDTVATELKPPFNKILIANRGEVCLPILSNLGKDLHLIVLFPQFILHSQLK
jgi:hypothetical protein